MDQVHQPYCYFSPGDKRSICVTAPSVSAGSVFFATAFLFKRIYFTEVRFFDLLQFLAHLVIITYAPVLLKVTLTDAGCQLKAALTSLLISSCRSGADLAVAFIMVDVWLSVSFLMHLWPATMLHTCTGTVNSGTTALNKGQHNARASQVLTSSGRYVCFCSCPTCRQGRWGYFSCRLYFCLKYWATVHSIACPFSNCRGNLRRIFALVSLLLLFQILKGEKKSGKLIQSRNA